MTSLIHSSSRALLFAGLIAILVQSAVAHTYLSSVYLNGAALVEGDCVRPHPASFFDSPIPFLNQSDMTLGWLPQAAVHANRKCPIAAGATIGIQFHHVNATASDNIIDPSHLGPIIVYLAKSDNGAGNVWFKIYEDGYTPADGKWAVDRLIANGGRVNVPLPSDIAPGNYLLRGELLALHGAYALDGVQPYVGCVELTVSGTGSANPTGVAFPGYYHNTDPGMLFNLYAPFTSYIIPGPAVYVSGSSPSSSGSATVAPTAPTAAPTKAPTSAPTTPTKAPTSAPSAPTSAPSTPTSAPTSAPSAPTTAPNGNGNNIVVGLNGGSSLWWLGVIVSGGGETTVKVELADSSSSAAWIALIDMSYAYVYDKSAQLQLPLSIRVTSSSGAQVTLTNVFTSLTTPTINTGKTYATTSTPTAAPTAPTTAPTAAPTTRPTAAPTTAPTPTHPTSPTVAPTPSGAKTTVAVYPGSSEWWFAVTVSGNSAAIASVQIMDAGAVTSFETMTTNAWGYSLSARGTQFVAPLTVRVTSVSGNTVTATITSLAPGSVSTNGQL